MSALIVLAIHVLQYPEDGDDTIGEIKASVQLFQIELDRLPESSHWRGPIKAVFLARELHEVCVGMRHKFTGSTVSDVH